jgi:hypothetical protein
MKLLGEVVIHQYVRKIQTSKARKPTFYKLGEKVPSKYASKIGLDYQWVKFLDGTFLANAKKEPIIKNKDSVGTPKFMIINGQSLHTLQLRDYERSKIIKAIKAQMIPEVAKLEPITEYPIRILCELHDTFEDMEHLTKNEKPKGLKWDVDNRTIFFLKTFPDVLAGCLEPDKDTGILLPTTKVIIPDDDRRYITQPPVPLFFPIDNTSKRKLVFKIYHDDRESIQQREEYKR